MRSFLAIVVGLTLLVPPGMCRCQIVGSRSADSPNPATTATDEPSLVAPCSCASCLRDAGRTESSDRAALAASAPSPAPTGSECPECPVLRTDDSSTWVEVSKPLPVGQFSFAGLTELVHLVLRHEVPCRPMALPPDRVSLRLVLHKFQI